MKLLKEFIKELLAEKRATEKGPSGLELIKRYANDTNLIHFSNLEKLGINPKTEFKTPVGIYGYPLTSGIIKQLETKTIPFAYDRKYVHIFRPLDEQNIVSSKSTNFQNFIDILTNSTKDSRELLIIKDAINNTRVLSPFGQFWNITRRLVDGNPIKWTKLFIKLGIHGVFDYDNGVIHPNEPTQAVIFGAQFIEHLVTAENPLLKNTEPTEAEFTIEKEVEEKEKQLLLIDNLKNMMFSYLGGDAKKKQRMAQIFRKLPNYFDLSSGDKQQIMKMYPKPGFMKRLLAFRELVDIIVPAIPEVLLKFLIRGEQLPATMDALEIIETINNFYYEDAEFAKEFSESKEKILANYPEFEEYIDDYEFLS